MTDTGVSVRWPAQYNVLPKEVFHRRDVYEAELQKIFYGPEWHPLAHLSEVPNKGDFKTLQIGEAPVLIVHGDDDKVRVFYNSCPHRGTQLQICARGSTKEIECPYHRWLFSLRGELLGASGMDQFEPNFRKENYGLKELRSGNFNGLVFATCSEEAPELAVFLKGTTDYLQKALSEDGRLKLIGYQKTIYATNWKEYGDNEGYHPPLLHRAFRLLRWQGGKGSNGVTEGGHKVVEAEVQPPKAVFLNDQSLVEFRDKSGPPRSIVVSLWPMTTIVKHMDVINIRYAFPLSQDETEVHYAYYAHQDDSEELLVHRIRQASNLLGPSGFISLEDGAVFSRVHAGSRTLGTVAYQKGYEGKPLSAPCFVGQNDEASNLLRWERYRTTMGFDRD
ncbi:MAG: anthranilate 1,2-dioxygenase large subunit [Alphaproteobacteria bacterium]|nr:anthranilate 1,2-dioxygenase large subunit [Alphaproteobacteria bacterium]